MTTWESRFNVFAKSSTRILASTGSPPSLNRRQTLFCHDRRDAAGEVSGQDSHRCPVFLAQGRPQLIASADAITRDPGPCRQSAESLLRICAGIFRQDQESRLAPRKCMLDGKLT